MRSQLLHFGGSTKLKILLLALVAVGIYCSLWIRDGIPYLSRWQGTKTIAERVSETQANFDSHLLPALRAVGIEGLPSEVALLFLKDKKSLELYAGSDSQSLHFIKAYEVKAASGHLGPKLKEGDKQVPEGIYEIEALNPNSSFYLSMKVGY